ncbi:MAG: hypothetical protein JO041_15750 [Acidobacteria bacterium]|nr:hypothetical protein [Acidobacteriota bacterium]
MKRFAFRLLPRVLPAMRLLSFALVISAFCLVSLAQPAVLDRTAFTFTRYDLKISISPATHELLATGTVQLRNDSKSPQRNLSLQISSSLAWQSIELGGKPVQYLAQAYTSDVDHTGELSEAVVSLPTAAVPGATVELAIRYAGMVVQNSGRLERAGAPPEVRIRQDWDLISSEFTVLRGAGFVVWYPVAMPAASISNGNEFAEAMSEWSAREQQAGMDLQLCRPAADSGADFVTSGRQEAFPAGTASGDCRRYSWSPLGLAAPSFALAQFKELNPVADFHIAYLEPAAEGARSYGEIAKSLAPFIAEWFGPPHQPAGVVQLPENRWAPYESGATLFSSLPESLSPQAEELTQVVLAHQLTHASLVSPRPWIFEGAAHFAQALERARQGGRGAALRYLVDQLPALREAEKHPGLSLINTTDDVYYRTKAMYCWWMLRDTVGDIALQHAFARYHAVEDRDAGYMQRLLEAEWRKPLDWFFNSWIYHDDGLPDYTIAAVSTRQSLAGGYLVAVTVENSGGGEAEVPVVVRSNESEAFGRVRVPAHGRATVRIQLGQYPATAIVNDGSVPESNFQNNSFKVSPPQHSGGG